MWHDNLLLGYWIANILRQNRPPSVTQPYKLHFNPSENTNPHWIAHPKVSQLLGNCKWIVWVRADFHAPKIGQILHKRPPENQNYKWKCAIVARGEWEIAGLQILGEAREKWGGKFLSLRKLFFNIEIELLGLLIVWQQDKATSKM